MKMLALAEENKRKSGLTKCRVPEKAKSRNIPLPDIIRWDVIISNCVINLSGDKDPRAEGSVSGAPNRGGSLAVTPMLCCAK